MNKVPRLFIVTMKAMKAKKEIHIGKMIHSKLKEQERSNAWLARQIYCTPANINRIFNNADIHTQQLWDISLALGIDLFACYSDALCKALTEGDADKVLTKSI
ncbi:MAG: hypothetical protein LBU62_11720 [Bacteroidales bacterium]|jgi:hypothetical protein|nr:hypothetical protein [Bacteroidales bacterium]